MIYKKFKLYFSITTLIISIWSLAIANNNTKRNFKKKLLSVNTKLVHIFKDKNGNELGKVYIEDFKNDVFKKLMITKDNKRKTDTLYFINNCSFINPKGVDISISEENFNGYKIEFFKESSFQLFSVGSKSSGASDPITIEWNYKKKIFQVTQSL